MKIIRTEILVIGGRGSGLRATLAANEEGAAVTLEKREVENALLVGEMFLEAPCCGRKRGAPNTAKIF